MADLSKLADDLSSLTVLEAARTRQAFRREMAAAAGERIQGLSRRYQERSSGVAGRGDQRVAALPQRTGTIQGGRRPTRLAITHGPTYSDIGRFRGGAKLPGSSKRQTAPSRSSRRPRRPS